MTLEQVVDRDECVRSFGAWQYPMLKHHWDLARYTIVLEDSRPEVVVECGTRTGHSALWFARHGVDVVTIDIAYQVADDVRADAIGQPRITHITQSSIDPVTVEWVREMVAGRRCMVSLDSDHSADHVAAEITAYAPLVSPGCYLVVEDGVIAWLPDDVLYGHGCQIYTGTVLEAIEQTLPGDERFERDTEIEAMFPATMYPAGWWRRR